MKLRALHGFCIGAGVDVSAGQEFDAPPHMVREWVTNGFAVPVNAADQLPTDGLLSSGRLTNQHGEIWNLDPERK
jgi:hypothetical protein